MKRKTQINQNEMAVVEVVTGKEVITTPGVSTCISISVKGQYGTHPFIALYHWEGFDLSFDKEAPGVEERARNAVNLEIRRFVYAIKRSFSGYHNIEKPWLTEIAIIGGEKATPYMSGTELEVETLKKYLSAYCHQYFTVMPDTRVIVQDYLTGKGDKSDSNTVTLTPYDITITSDDAAETVDLTDREKTDSELTISDEDTHEEPIIRHRKS